MKKWILPLLLMACAVPALAQCDKHLWLTSSKTEYLDAAGSVERTEAENSTIEVFKDTIIIAPGNESHTMTGTIVSHTCNWTVPFKEGKSVMKVQLSDGNNEPRNLTITIEGKDGKVSFHALVEEMPDRQIRVPIDSFAEKSS